MLKHVMGIEDVNKLHEAHELLDRYLRSFDEKSESTPPMEVVLARNSLHDVIFGTTE